MMYCKNCEYAVTRTEVDNRRCNNCGKDPAHETAGPATQSATGRILHLVEKIVDHTKEGGEEIAGWRMAAIRDAADAIEKELSN